MGKGYQRTKEKLSSYWVAVTRQLLVDMCISAKTVGIKKSVIILAGIVVARSVKVAKRLCGYLRGKENSYQQNISM